MLIDKLERLEKIIRKFKADLETHISKDSSLSKDIGLASLDYFMLISDIEEEFGVSISDKELMEIKTVGDVLDCIESKNA